MTININKKQIIIALSAIAIIVIGVIGYNSYRTSQYEKHVAEFKENAYKLYVLSGYMCSEVNSVWRGYIFDDKKCFNTKSGQSLKWSYSSEENVVYCSNFSEIIAKLENFYSSHGITDLADSYRKNMKHAFEQMTPPPGKYKDVHNTMQKMYNSVNTLYKSATSPDGSLQTYTTSVNETAENFNEAFEQSEIEICPIEDKKSMYEEKVLKEVLKNMAK